MGSSARTASRPTAAAEVALRGRCGLGPALYDSCNTVFSDKFCMKIKDAQVSESNKGVVLGEAVRQIEAKLVMCAPEGIHITQ